LLGTNLGADGRVQVVEDVVGVAGESIEGMNRGPLIRRQ
jgi:hypothetical protein